MWKKGNVMNRRLTLAQYRGIDLFFFSVMLVISETVITLAATRWFPDQLYTVSVTAALTMIVMMRWGPWCAVHALLGGLVFCVASGAGARQYAVYCVGNLMGLACLPVLRAIGGERVRKDVLLSLLTALLTQLLMQLGRGVLAVLAMGASSAQFFAFFTTDALSDLFSMVIIWIARRLDGMFENQVNYLLRIQKGEDERSGFS